VRNIDSFYLIFFSCAFWKVHQNRVKVLGRVYKNNLRYVYESMSLFL